MITKCHQLFSKGDKPRIKLSLALKTIYSSPTARGTATLICVSNDDQKFTGTRELQMNQYTKSQSITDYADETMFSSLSNSKPLTSSCGQSTKVPRCPQEGEHKAIGFYNPVCEPDRGKTVTDTLADTTECGSLQSSNPHNRNQQQLSLTPGSDDPTNWPFLGKTMFKEIVHSNFEARVSLGPILSEGQSSQRSTNVARIRSSTKCETWVVVLVVICLLAVGLVRLRMTEKVMEEKIIELEDLKSKVNTMEQLNIEIEHFKSRVKTMELRNIEIEDFKSRVNMLERLVHRMSEANYKVRIQTTFKTTMGAPMAMRFPKGPHRFPVFTGTTNQPAPRGGGLSRAKRDAGQPKNATIKGVMKSVIDDYCDTRSGTCRQTTGKLEFVQFHAVFNGSALDQHISTMTPDFNGDPNKVEIEADWPLILGFGGFITYIHPGSPLHIYEARKPQSVDNSTVLVENSHVSSTFTVKISGLYAVHLNMTISDEKHRNKQYIGVYVNGQVVLGCPNGGLCCSENPRDSPATRLCNINGVLNLKDSDRIQLKTMEAKITILVDPKKFNSVFTMVLLHKN